MVDDLKESIRDDLMRTWREGARDGLKMAHNMAEAVRNEAARQCGEDCTVEQRTALEAQVAALGGLMAALLTAADEAVRDVP